jgi:rhodanese-related sulfurtransferase
MKNKGISFILSGLVICVLTSGCWSSNKKARGPLVINVLDKALYDDCHIPGSIQVDFDRVESHLKNTPKVREIIVYCSNSMCTASHFVVQKLLDVGYTNAKVYAAGMAGWFLAGYPVEGPAQAPYLKKALPIADEAHAFPTISTKELAERLKMV